MADEAFLKQCREKKGADLDRLRAARIGERLCEDNCFEPDPPPMEKLENAAFSAAEFRRQAEALADCLGT